MNAEIIAVGTEILLGRIVNTNAQYISKQLATMGINMYFQSAVGDNPDRLKEVLSIADKRSDLVIITGGLGPTQDDLTKETLAHYLGYELVEDKQTLEKITAFFKSINREMPPNNIKQAYVIKGSVILHNSCGTAPGMIVDNKFVLLPGPPNEMMSMFEDVKKHICHSAQIKTTTLKLFGIGEGAAEQKIVHLLSSTDPTVAPYAKPGEVELCVTSSSGQEKIDQMVLNIRSILGDYIYSDADETLAQTAVRLLAKHNKTLCTAESLTGGLIGDLITQVSGASDVFLAGICTYSNDMKVALLGVNKDTLDTYGAVSEQVAIQMAQGAKEQTKSDIALSVTGIAGPNGGTEQKPVGLVYLGYCDDEKCYSVKLNIFGDRNRIREMAAKNALYEIIKNLGG